MENLAPARPHSSTWSRRFTPSRRENWRTPLPYDTLHPVILPGLHPLALKVVAAFHQRLLHAGTYYELSHVRQHF